jgi:hypothetical protein
MRPIRLVALPSCGLPPRASRRRASTETPPSPPRRPPTARVILVLTAVPLDWTGCRPDMLRLLIGLGASLNLADTATHSSGRRALQKALSPTPSLFLPASSCVLHSVV